MNAADGISIGNPMELLESASATGIAYVSVRQGVG